MLTERVLDTAEVFLESGDVHDHLASPWPIDGEDLVVDFGDAP